ncbi:MAG: hypothetical protein RR958_25860, partial [Pseudomonas sp.]
SENAVRRMRLKIAEPFCSSGNARQRKRLLGHLPPNGEGAMFVTGVKRRCIYRFFGRTAA